MTEEELDIVHMLRDDAGPQRPNKFLLAAELIERLIRERDEARSWVCIMKAQSVTYAYPAEHFAREHGWDCFKEVAK